MPATRDFKLPLASPSEPITLLLDLLSSLPIWSAKRTALARFIFSLLLVALGRYEEPDLSAPDMID